MSSIEETRGVAHLGGIPAEEREDALARIVIQLKHVLLDKHEIVILKTGDAIYGYTERAELLTKINSICESRVCVLSKEEREMWSSACELEYTKMLWDMLDDIHRFNLICDFNHPAAFALFTEDIRLRLFHSQQQLNTIYNRIGECASNW